MKEEITLQINGASKTVNVDPATPLLYVLRNNLELNGPKYGCGLEQCGACMVLLDGDALPSCRIPVSEVKDYKITSLEGLIKENGELHPLQQSFYQEQAAQCGFCLNGVIISAAALLKENPTPNRAEINTGMERVICRCGTHSRFIRAINAAVSNNME